MPESGNSGYEGARWDLLLVVGLFAANFMLRLGVLAPTGFDGLYGQDSYAYYDFAGELLNFAKTQQPPGPFFWPIGYPLGLALAFAVFGTSASVGQMLSVLLGVLLSPLVYGLARQLGSGRLGALAAGTIMTLCGQALQSSIVLMSDVPASAWATMSGVCLLRYLHTDRRRWLALAAFLLALAAVTRWVYLLLAVLWGLTVLAAWWRRFDWRKRLLDVLAAGLAVTIIVAPQHYYSQVNPSTSLDHSYVREWSLGNAFQREFTTSEGHLRYEKTNAAYYGQVYYDALYLSLLFLPLLVIGTVAAIKQQQGILIGWATLPYLFLVGIPAQNIRFPLIAFPAVAVLVGMGIDSIVGWLERLDTHRHSFIRIGYLMLILWGLFGGWQMLDKGVSITNQFIANQQREKAVANWTMAQIPEGGTLYTFALTPTFRHYSTLEVVEIFNEAPPAVLRQRWTKGQDDYLLIDTNLVERQWGELSPGIAYYWLRDERGLVRIGKNANYTLFRVKG